MTIEHGMRCIGRERQKPPSHYLKSADQLEWPIAVLWKYPNDSRILVWDGLSKLLSSMLTTGYRRNEGQMETHTAQGFLRLLLNETEAALVLAKARQINRYLIPLEVSKMLKKDIKKTVTDIEEQRMNETWLAFCKETNSDQRIGCTDPLVLEDWFNYVAKNYQEPLPEASPWDN